MSPVTHFLLGWAVANTSINLKRKERTLITVAGIIPDIDGLGLVADLLTRNSAHATTYFADYHHILAHNLGAALVVTLIGFFLATHRWLTALLIFLSFHLHLLCDLVGSRSPDGYQWAIPYLLPFSHAWQLTWQGQWELNAWPNFLITGAALVAMFWLAIKRSYSPLEMISKRADRALVETLQKRFKRAG
jgi:hypothetical protein